ncbi:hypothetical protein TCDM_11056 [Trypanosoma cruzi Dm28c]|uniref:Uncharacterized protein n=1 Tax=Trypanosoma cruzi Dm28c TaxID=1416333 RepID=V5B5T7_TRYCR|nr:hypothetical protein TCDM_11056 [Trypanosoma cruzi Dm28c]
MDEESLPRVALWVIARLVCVVFVGSGAVAVSRGPWDGTGDGGGGVSLLFFHCGWLLAVCAFVVWRAESSHPRTDGTAMVRVCEGWCGVAGQGEGRGAAFPARNLFLPCVCAAFCLSPLFSCASAWSGRLLTGHVDCECVLTASIHFSPPVCLPFPVVCGVLHRVRAGPHTPTARRDLPCCCSFLWAMVLRAVPSGLSFSRSLHRCSALLCSPLTFLVYCRCCCCLLHLLNTVTLGRKENKRGSLL